MEPANDTNDTVTAVPCPNVGCKGIVFRGVTGWMTYRLERMPNGELRDSINGEFTPDDGYMSLYCSGCDGVFIEDDFTT